MEGQLCDEPVVIYIALIAKLYRAGFTFLLYGFQKESFAAGKDGIGLLSCTENARHIYNMSSLYNFPIVHARRLDCYQDRITKSSSYVSM